MFKRFSVQTTTKLVKTPKSDKAQSSTPDPQPIDYEKVAEEVGASLVAAAVAVIGTYMVADTLRQVTIAIVKAKL